MTTRHLDGVDDVLAELERELRNHPLADKLREAKLQVKTAIYRGDD